MNPLSCDLFCRVIDNYGDIGVCWRLAQQLQGEYGWQVRLWIDEPVLLPQLATPNPDIEVCHWSTSFPEVTPAKIVIEAFACELPDNYLAAMAQQQDKPLWINLEYLCVEDWGPSFHCQPSPHPRQPLTKYFFVPGIQPGTGGLLCEQDLLERRANHTHTPRPALDVFLFCYDNPALPHLLTAWVNGPQPIHCRVAAGKPAAQIGEWLNMDFAPRMHFQRGMLSLEALPFVPQSDFDALLWQSDLNFVRGEDSFARAQWAALPMIWHIYPQAEDAHHTKLAAFQQHYSSGLDAAAANALTTFTGIWNGLITPTETNISAAWEELNCVLPALKTHAVGWQKQLLTLGNLAENLAIFHKNR
ncbi:MAG: elongation factor P maturation arginine rhamnosyltransferase EarP [Rhodocyclaceae bacterium]|nr:elongation factor P maturation arginine rhamnosyltransferase EarP [Rhodocyclaceae bacterium]